MESVMHQFREMQAEAETKFQSWEEERWKRESETEERRRKEEREHERQMLQMLLQQQQVPVYPTYTNTYPNHNMYPPYDEEDN